MVVLRALGDPANPVLVAAALEGLFFGPTSGRSLRRADGREGARHRAAAGGRSVTGRPCPGRSCTGGGWRPDATGPTSSWSGCSTKPGSWRTPPPSHWATAGLERCCAWPKCCACWPLTAALRFPPRSRPSKPCSSRRPTTRRCWPHRSDAVRVMNLHKAKGLEARIVILAAPVKEAEHAINCHVDRAPDGRATGGLRITHQVGSNRVETLAQPIGWNLMEASEAEFPPRGREGTAALRRSDARSA